MFFVAFIYFHWLCYEFEYDLHILDGDISVYIDILVPFIGRIKETELTPSWAATKGGKLHLLSGNLNDFKMHFTWQVTAY